MRKMKDDFPTLIREARAKLGMTATEFGKEMGVSVTAVSLWESGKREAPYRVLYRCQDIIKNYQKCDKCKGKGYIRTN
jgi:transcriptional regulator with XRE-family HTH domain